MSNNLRSSQILSPFGIGQIVNFPDEQSYMICGLHLWDNMLEVRRSMGGHIDEREFTIRESRLEKLLGVQKFKKPFPFKRTGQVNKYLEIPGVRFPQWHHCTNPRCGRMRKIELTQADRLILCDSCGDEKRKSKMIPVRFIAACVRGHIQDVPFKEWVHDGTVSNDEGEHNLSYHAGIGSGDLNSITIKCSCGIRPKSLGGIMNVSKTPDGIIYNSSLASIGLTEEERRLIDHSNPNNENANGQYCKGSRPWLGPDHMNDSCGHHLQVLIRGGSNIHYSDIISALYLPDFDTLTNPVVGKIVEDVGFNKLIDRYHQDEDHRMLRMTLEDRNEVKFGQISLQDAFSEIERLIKDSNEEDESGREHINSEIELRSQEYQYILNERNSENADFKSKVNGFDKYNDSSFLERYFERVVLIEKLKETRVFRSFARISPDNRVESSELSSENLTWLPAYQVFGEGIFLQFKESRLDEWLTQFSENDYPLIQRFWNNVRNPNPRHEGGLTPAFVMMHTFAHLLIKRLCFNCGYGSSSLRERIYFRRGDANRMNGILIYTSSGDSEGSLGGLVRQGKEKYLAKLIKEAIEDANWCSADPVCSDIGQSSGQGPDNVNGSACHNCCLVPETSCEEFNVLLDRAVVTGTLENSQLGYFNV
ncbi:MAG: DUF1998 domain-containing protein [Phaeodactylibacter sp.]|nr:DUF1998 domain-containing protein [Phaeodactylibacter sp.]MCB9292602.1 DUF1998 domain-containing protein [Lewinellaceae bacterium]